MGMMQPYVFPASVRLSIRALATLPCALWRLPGSDTGGVGGVSFGAKLAVGASAIRAQFRRGR